MEVLTPAEYTAILRQDLCSFIGRCFLELNRQTRLLMNWHVEVMAAKLEECRQGKIRRLIINIPPRHLKSRSPTNITSGSCASDRSMVRGWSSWRVIATGLEAEHNRVAHSGRARGQARQHQSAALLFRARHAGQQGEDLPPARDGSGDGMGDSGLVVPHVSQTIDSTIEAINAGLQSLKAGRGVLGKMAVIVDHNLAAGKSKSYASLHLHNDGRTTE